MQIKLNETQGIEQLEKLEAIKRLTRKDGRLFSKNALTIQTIEDRLGWVSLTENIIPYFEGLQFLRNEAQERGITSVVVIGMGGSTLAPEVFSKTFGPQSDIELEIVDYTFPSAIQKLIKRLDFEKTFFVVASKSGTTIETHFLSRIFYQHARQQLGKQAPKHFIAITNTATPLHEMAQAQRWLHVVFARSTIGGRFSALSSFGLAPASFLNIDYHEFFERAESMERACQNVDVEQNPGALLANFLHAAHCMKRSQVMLLISPNYKSLGHWLEQLIAESLGKDGKGIAPLITSTQRLNALPHDHMSIIAIADESDTSLIDYWKSIESDVPRTLITISSKNCIGAEFVRWEYAVVLAGLLMGVNPLDQPNVSASKASAMEILHGEDEPIELLPLDELAAHKRKGDYLAILAFMEESTHNCKKLLDCAEAIEAELQIPVTVGYGPRYLHSIGQLYKGGPDNAMFLIVSELNKGVDIEIPRERWSLKEVLAAQKKGDVISLKKQGRRVFQAASLKELAQHYLKK